MVEKKEEDNQQEEIKEPDSENIENEEDNNDTCLLYTSPSPRDQRGSRMPSSG